ncbi:hypothetical protein [Wolbachia endosymbiont of Psylliodes chrysocephala]|uniref:hypothetical protein n=1 Tax=Wolbachia endosymbiont of Psylliodes chrysocephala TaxID=2883236 RepID=UPI00209ED1BD|nr:hypothetical protein [Wolbachia endosymbiont of Psylliodes chrysocephala]
MPSSHIILCHPSTLYLVIPVSGHWDDTFVFEAKPAITFNTLLLQTNVRTAMGQAIG